MLMKTVILLKNLSHLVSILNNNNNNHDNLYGAVTRPYRYSNCVYLSTTFFIKQFFNRNCVFYEYYSWGFYINAINVPRQSTQPETSNPFTSKSSFNKYRCMSLSAIQSSSSSSVPDANQLAAMGKNK